MALFLNDSDSDMEVIMEIFDSESDEERNQRRGSASRNYKRINYMHTQCLNDAEFTFRFRINKAAVEILLTEIMPFVKVTSKRNNGVSPLHQLLLTLRFYALGTMLISVADFIGVSKSSASNIVRDISFAIGNIIGEQFRNRKGYFSLNVQGVCDADLKLMNVVARWHGSVHDATIFNNSILRVRCENGAFGNNWLLGDSAYPNRTYLLTPMLNPASPSEHRYNEAHIKTRNTIERTFGIWKRRFPVIALPLRLSLQNSQAVIIATAVLHNICRNYNAEEIPPEVELPPMNDVDPGAPNASEDIRQRAELINHYFV